MRQSATLLAALALAFPLPALAQTQLIPPAKYDYTPTMPVSVHVMPQREVLQHCRNAYGFFIRTDVEGCQYFAANGDCVVIATDNPIRAVTLQQLLQHEFAHCNGWRHE